MLPSERETLTDATARYRAALVALNDAYRAWCAAVGTAARSGGRYADVADVAGCSVRRVRQLAGKR